MQELWDAEGVRELLCEICAGTVKVREIYTETASPMSLPLQWEQEAAVMYDYAPTPRGIHNAVEDMLKEAVKPGSQELSQLQEYHLLREKLPKDARQLHALLMTEGDLAAGELEVPVEWLDSLARNGRVCYLEQGLWIAAEEAENTLRRLAQHFGLIIPQNVQQSPVKHSFRLSGECCATEAPPTLPRLPAVMDCRSLLQRLS